MIKTTFVFWKCGVTPTICKDVQFNNFQWVALTLLMFAIVMSNMSGSQLLEGENNLTIAMALAVVGSISSVFGSVTMEVRVEITCFTNKLHCGFFESEIVTTMLQKVKDHVTDFLRCFLSFSIFPRVFPRNWKYWKCYVFDWLIEFSSDPFQYLFKNDSRSFSEMQVQLYGFGSIISWALFLVETMSRGNARVLQFDPNGKILHYNEEWMD